jgi:predicted ATPase/DNA-binding CsgD family transcriptional regulator
LIGRASDALSVQDLVARSRLVTIAGGAGIGKTRLALEVARDRLPLHRDGVFFIDLAPLSGPGLVPGTVAAALEVPAGAEGLGPYLRSREVLLVLDNAEHLIEAVAAFASARISDCPSLTVLTTSREPLGVLGEAVWRLAALPQADAVALFRDRAQLAAPNVPTGAADSDSIGELCRRLDGIPLAIELAATRLRLSTVPEMLAGLDESIAAIGGRIRAAPDRHRTLRAAFDWSYTLLEPAERQLFRSLGIFVGGFDADAARQIGSSPSGHTQHQLESLVEKSLVARRPQPGAQARYDMLATLHSYAAELLEEAGEADLVRRCHAEYFTSLAELAEPGLYGPDQRNWMRRVEMDVDNFRSAASWCLDHDPSRAVAMTGALHDFFGRSGRSREGLALIQAALDKTSDETPERARALVGAAFLSAHVGDYENTAEIAGQAERMARRVGNAHRLATALAMVGQAANARGLNAEADRAFRDMREAAIAAHDGGLQGVALVGAAIAAYGMGDPAKAMALAVEARDTVRPVGDLDVLVYTIDLSAELKVLRGDVAGARPDWLEALSITDPRYELAETYFIVSGLALAEGMDGNRGRALRLAGACERMREEIDLAIPANALEVAVSNLVEATIARIRKESGAQGNEEWSLGRSLTAWEAAALAAAPALPETGPSLSPLSRREAEVALLVAEGMTSRSIAGRLHLAERTVENHVQSALNKLNLNSRAQLAAWVAHRAGGTQVKSQQC